MENESSEKPASDPLQPTLASLPVKIEYAEEREKENSLGINLLTAVYQWIFSVHCFTLRKCSYIRYITYQYMYLLLEGFLICWDMEWKVLTGLILIRILDEDPYMNWVASRENHQNVDYLLYIRLFYVDHSC